VRGDPLLPKQPADLRPLRTAEATNCVFVSAVHSSTARPRKDRYTHCMDTNYVTGTLVAGWALALSIVALATDVTRSSSWFALAVVGAVPTLVLLRLQRVPARSTSPRIQEALR
jgi:hypothetical protein